MPSQAHAESLGPSSSAIPTEQGNAISSIKSNASICNLITSSRPCPAEAASLSHGAVSVTVSAGGEGGAKEQGGGGGRGTTIISSNNHSVKATAAGSNDHHASDRYFFKTPGTPFTTSTPSMVNGGVWPDSVAGSSGITPSATFFDPLETMSSAKDSPLHQDEEEEEEGRQGGEGGSHRQPATSRSNNDMALQQHMMEHRERLSTYFFSRFETIKRRRTEELPAEADQRAFSVPPSPPPAPRGGPQVQTSHHHHQTTSSSEADNPHTPTREISLGRDMSEGTTGSPHSSPALSAISMEDVRRLRSDSSGSIGDTTLWNGIPRSLAGLLPPEIARSSRAATTIMKASSGSSSSSSSSSSCGSHDNGGRISSAECGGESRPCKCKGRRKCLICRGCAGGHCLCEGCKCETCASRERQRMAREESEKERAARERELEEEQERMFKEARQRMDARQSGMTCTAFNRPSPPRPVSRSHSMGSEGDGNNGSTGTSAGNNINPTYLPQQYSEADAEALQSADWHSPSWYRRLGVEVGVDVDEIRRRYKKLCLIYHPDRSKHPNALDAFVNIRQAYEGLMRLHSAEL